MWKKGEYNILLLFSNKLCLNENFKSMIVVGYSGNKFEIIGECIDIRDFTKEKYIIGYTSIDAIMLTSYNSKFQVYGLPKELISHYLDLFTKEE